MPRRQAGSGTTLRMAVTSRAPVATVASSASCATCCRRWPRLSSALSWAWPLVTGGEEGVHIPLTEDPEIDGRLTMVNASYQGTDAKNRPFAVRGAEAFQPESDSPIVHLSEIEADIFRRSGTERPAGADGERGHIPTRCRATRPERRCHGPFRGGSRVPHLEGPCRPAGGNRKGRRAGERHGPARAARCRQLRAPGSGRGHDLRWPGSDDPVPGCAGRKR